jgi:hypothetical protein
MDEKNPVLASFQAIINIRDEEKWNSDSGTNNF